MIGGDGPHDHLSIADGYFVGRMGAAKVYVETGRFLCKNECFRAPLHATLQSIAELERGWGEVRIAGDAREMPSASPIEIPRGIVTR